MRTRAATVVLALSFIAVLGLSVRASQVSPLSGEGLRLCGNEGEEPCGLFERDLYNETCDSGLAVQQRICGCLLRGPFGGCLLWRRCESCVNATRNRARTTSTFADSWAAWALRNQRDQLALDEPVNWVMHLGTHNAFNSHSDGHQLRLLHPALSIIDAPNQFYSMTDQLNLGSRMLAIDAHWVGPPDNARLCHSLTELGPAIEQLLCLTPIAFSPVNFPSMRYFANGIKEIRNWLNRNPDQILLLNIENRVGACPTCQGGAEAEAYITEPLEAYFSYVDAAGRRQSMMLATGPTPKSGSMPPPEPSTFPSRAELLARGKRVVVLVNNELGPGGKEREDRKAPYLFGEGGYVSGAYPVWTRNNQNFDECKDSLVDRSDHFGPARAERYQFTVIVEDRTLQQFFLDEPMGHISAEDMRRVANCNYTIVATDFLGSQIPFGRTADLPDFSRHEAAVWSWKPGDKGQNGDCAMFEGASGRWASADCSRPRRFVCAPPRSESGTADRQGWRMLEDRWLITAAAGPWEDGPAACAAEFPFDPGAGTRFVFSVPVNGFQNEKLRQSNVNRDDLWLNYTDRITEGAWIIPKIESENSFPVAAAGRDQRLECGVDTVLNGLGSSDADGDPLTYTWTGPFGTMTGPTATVRLEPGTHEISLTVDDGRGGSNSDTVVVVVRDTKPPQLGVSMSPSSLSPADGGMVPVTAQVHVSDACDGDDVGIELRSIVAYESGKVRRLASDIQGAEFGTGDLEFSLRAGSRTGAARVYVITYKASDRSNRSVTRRTVVGVPASPSAN